LRETDEISHQHGEPAVARQRDHLPIRERTLGADRLRHGIGHRAVPEGADEPALSVHGEIPSRPDRGQADITGKDGVRRGAVANRLGDLLRMDDVFRRVTFGEIVKLTARLGIVALRVR
jgi:hypothetical protein